MNLTKRKSTEVWHISGPKNILRLMRNPSRHKSPVTKKKGFFRDVGESTKDSLLAGELSDGRHHPAVVPKGFLAVYVGPVLRRYLIPAVYLSMPDFMILMERAAEEFGFEQEGGLTFPCDEKEFEETLARCKARQKNASKSKRSK